MAIPVAESSMSSQVAEAGRMASADPTKAEELYRGVLSRTAGEFRDKAEVQSRLSKSALGLQEYYRREDIPNGVTCRIQL